MKRALAVATVLAAGAAVAEGRIIADPAQGAFEVSLWLYPDSYAVLKNRTDSPADFDSYEIRSASGLLHPGNWESIADHVSDPTSDDWWEATNQLGAGALFFSELSASSYLLCERSSSASACATLQPGATWHMADHLLGGSWYPYPGEMEFYYTKPGVAGDKFAGWASYPPMDTALIAVTVFSDKNQNGVFDGDDEGLPGWQVTIEEKEFGSYPYTYTTGQDGIAYMYVTAAGGVDNYFTVTENLQAGWTGTTGLTSNVVLMGTDIVGVNFGNYIPEPATLLLLAVGGAALLVKRRRKRAAKEVGP